jgi:hypothetical protein
MKLFELKKREGIFALIGIIVAAIVYSESTGDDCECHIASAKADRAIAIAESTAARLDEMERWLFEPALSDSTLDDLHVQWKTGEGK